jgi:hypothetical protein
MADLDRCAACRHVRLNHRGQEHQGSCRICDDCIEFTEPGERREMPMEQKRED